MYKIKENLRNLGPVWLYIPLVDQRSHGSRSIVQTPDTKLVIDDHRWNNTKKGKYLPICPLPLIGVVDPLLTGVLLPLPPQLLSDKWDNCCGGWLWSKLYWAIACFVSGKDCEDDSRSFERTSATDFWKQRSHRLNCSVNK